MGKTSRYLSGFTENFESHQAVGRPSPHILCAQVKNTNGDLQNPFFPTMAPSCLTKGLTHMSTDTSAPLSPSIHSLAPWAAARSAFGLDAGSEPGYVDWPLCQLTAFLMDYVT